MASPTSNDLGKKPVSVDDDSDVDDLDGARTPTIIALLDH